MIWTDEALPSFLHFIIPSSGRLAFRLPLPHGLSSCRTLWCRNIFQFLLVLVLVITIFTFTAMALFGDQLEAFSNPIEALDSVMGLTVRVGYYE